MTTGPADSPRPPESPIETARAWWEAEPDDDIRAELDGLLGAAEAGDESALVERFTGRLAFGTAGLRAAVGAGPTRMNRLVVRQAAAGLADHLLATDPTTATRGVLIGFDARRKSDTFAADTARVLAARGVPARLFDQVVPTPVLAWSITDVDAAAGVMVTASHNPPADNGYKVYLGSGAQIVSPVDAEIAAAIAAVDPLDVALADPDDPLISRLGDTQVEAYLAEVPAVRLCPDVPPVTVASTALHGVGGAVLVAAFERSGLGRPLVVAAQQEPDGTFPTVAFPNPEEPGAMDLVIAEAQRSGAVLALANDPDADRLGAAVPTPEGTWRRLSGDEIGWLLADHILSHTEGADRLVVTTLVSSSLLTRMAEHHGVHAIETFTGFKWIAKEVLEHPGLRFVFGYEQALGFLVAGRPLDKDGITAAVLLAEVAALACADGTDLLGRLAAIEARFGRFIVTERSVAMSPEAGAAAVARLVSAPPTVVAARDVVSVREYPEAGLLRLVLDGGVRVQVRPSGTEPKVKIYGEGVGIDPGMAVDAVAAFLSE
ncbi:MAG: phospho-sugar mutase [Ilumatobacteraceae bacterium]